MIKKLCLTLMVLSLSFVEGKSSSGILEENKRAVKKSVVRKNPKEKTSENTVGFNFRVMRRHAFYYSSKRQTGYFQDGEFYEGPLTEFRKMLLTKRNRRLLTKGKS